MLFIIIYMIMLQPVSKRIFRFITLEDTNGNRKLLKKRREQKIDNVAAMMDAYIAYKLNKEAFE